MSIGREWNTIGRGIDIRYEVFPDLGGANAIYQMPIISSSKMGAWWGM